MRVFVTGGTGAIGLHALPALVAAGHEVSALARSAEKAEIVARSGARPIGVSLFDVPALTAAFVGQDAVVNLASALPSMARFVLRGAWHECTRIRTEGSAAVVTAALACGVERVVQESVCMIYADHGADWIDERAPTDRFPAAVGNHAAEASAARFRDEGGIGVVLRLGLFYGPAATHSEQLLALARRGIAPVFGPPGSYTSSIHLADAASAVVAALRAPAGVFNVVDDDPLTNSEYIGVLADAVGKRPWFRGPGRASALLGDRLTSLTRSLRVSNAAFRAATSWSPRYRSGREGWRSFAYGSDAV